MKKILTSLAFGVISLASFAQATQEYMRVTFNVPMADYEEPKSGKTGTPVSAGMKDSYVYINPEHQYIDFNVSEHPLTFRTTATVKETGSFYLQQIRNTQSYVEDKNAQFPYDCDRIESITQYSIPVEKVELMEAVPVKQMPYLGQKKPGGGDLIQYNVWEYTFNRLPRNVAELKTLMEDGNGNRIQRCYDDPAFIVAVMYLLTPRFLDCSQDCRDMIDYMFGKFHSARGVNFRSSNADFQDLCTAKYNGNFGKDANCTYWNHNHVYEWFKGAIPSNQYKPNGKDYGYDNGPYTVYVLQDQNPADSGKFYLISNPYEEIRANYVMDGPTSCPVFVKKTSNDGWFFENNFKNYFAAGKDQINPDL